MEKEIVKLTLLRNAGAIYNYPHMEGNLYMDKNFEGENILMIKEAGMSLELSDRYEQMP